jgi:hypothetical protein
MVLWWFDTLASAQVFTEYDGNTPKVCLDDKRQTQRGASDILFNYMRSGTLCQRMQRDRFTIERALAPIDPRYVFTKAGMNSVNRVQFQFDPVPA